jgi:ribonuclease HI
MIEIWTDGACSGNPGAGGWGALIITPSGKKTISGSEPNTTNNRMELLAAIKALELCNDEEIKIFTDSTYLKQGITEWIKKWSANGWRSANRKAVKNKDLWQRLLNLTQNRNVQWQWVKAHSGIEYNERADALATEAIKKLND